MSISAFIPELLLHHNDQVQAWARIASDIEKGLADGTLTKDEWAELMTELDRLKVVICVADDMFTYAAMARIIDGLVAIAKTVKFI